ncbi:putative T7SS-secreted protein [Streptomyces sp. bgisy100]|uniref:putative T7SS-secreted protein n=1 Tax=Streptomyces sp. bgisy100 TaxID=3413783 RepID=UPI003D74E9F3
MTARPPVHEWEVLGESSDPVPGDPYTVAALGKKLRATADSLKRQADEIKAVGSVEAWKSKAADEFRGEAEEAEGKLRKAFKRYDVAAKAMGTEVKEGVETHPKEFASELDRAQKLAAKALKDAQEADTEHKSSTKALDGQPKDTPDDDPDSKKLKGRQEAAETKLSDARKTLQDAKDIRDAAEKAACEAIGAAISDDGLEDGTWDKFKDWVHDNADLISKIADIAGWVATICGTLSLLVGWIPIIGQALAAVLGTIALLATMVSLVTHLMLALAGEGSWFDVAMDVVGLATFGIGRGAMAGAKAAASGTKSLARSSIVRKEMAKIGEKGLKRGSKAFNKAQQAAFKAGNRGSDDALRGKAGAEAMQNTPKGWFPGKSALREAMSPKAIAKESWDSIKGLKAFKDAPDLVRSSTRGEAWAGAAPKIGDSGIDDLARGVDRIDDAAKMDDAVKAGIKGFDTQTRIWAGSTGFASALDGADKAGAGDALGLKDATTTGNG